MKRRLSQIIAHIVVICLFISMFPFCSMQSNAKGVEKIVTYSEASFWRKYYSNYGEKDTFDLVIKGPDAAKVYDRLIECESIESDLFKEYHDKSKIYQANMVAAWSTAKIEKTINTFSPNDSELIMHFTADRLEIFKRFKKYVDAATKVALPALKEMNLEEMNDYERIETVSKWLAEQCSYDWECYYNILGFGPWQERFADYNAKSVCGGYEAIVNKRGICQTYSGATEFLLQLMGYEAVRIEGDSYLGEHAWNYVKLDGKWYAIDNTWNDTDDETVFKKDYFLVGADTFYLKHSDSVNEKESYPLAATAYQGNSQIELSPIITGEEIESFPEEEKVLFPSIKVGKSVYTTTVGKTVKPVIVIKNPNKEKVTYTSLNNKVASVNSKGVIKAKKKGSATIVVRVGKNSAKKFTVKVK